MVDTHSETKAYSDAEILAKVPGRISSRLFSVLVALAGVGLVGFVAGLFAAPQRAWQVYLVNFLFFSGLAAAGVLFGAAMQLAKGHWGKSMHRFAQGFGAFLPLSFVLFLIFYFGSDLVFPWIENPVNHEGHALPAAWFSVGNLFLRGAVFLALFYGLCFAFMYFTLRPDMPLVVNQLSGWRQRLVAWTARDYQSADDESARSRRVLGRLSPVLALAYVAVLSGMAIDLIMSLAPGWLSVLYPAYFFIGAWLSALAGTALMAALFRRYHNFDVFASNQWHDLGKLIFAFCVFWAYLWFSQFLPIWFGNLPRETFFIEVRTEPPWTVVSIAFFALVFVIPFVSLLWQKAKMVPGYLASVAVIIMAGLWLERFNEVIASIWTESVPFGWIELLVTLGFVGAFGLTYALYASTFPMVPLRENLIIGSARKGPY